MMTINRSIDIEDVIREALTPFFDVYCRPLPQNFLTPSLLVTQVGGAQRDRIDTFDVTLDARAQTDAKASETLRNAVGALVEIAKSQESKIASVTVNTSGAWGSDPVRPDLKMCSARLTVTAHIEQHNLEVMNHDE